MKRKIVLVIIILIILIMAFYLIFNKNIKNENEKNESEKVEFIKNNYYRCNGKSYKLDNYTVYNIFNIHFQNEKLVNGNKVQIFEFDNIDSYKNFEKEINQYFNPSNIIHDDIKLTITYEFSYYITQKDDQTEQDYLEMMLKDGYECKIEQ